MVLFVLGLLMLLSRPTVAQVLGTLKLNAPPTISQCEQVQLSWGNQEGPYNLSVVTRLGVPTDSIDAERYLDRILILTSETSYTWTVNYTTGQMYGLMVTALGHGKQDGYDVQTYVTIGDGPRWCMSNQSSAAQSTSTRTEPASTAVNGVSLDFLTVIFPETRTTTSQKDTTVTASPLPPFGGTTASLKDTTVTASPLPPFGGSPSASKNNIIKIVVPVVVVGVLALCFGIWLFWFLRRRQRRAKESEEFAARRAASPFQIDTGTQGLEALLTPYPASDPSVEEKGAPNVQVLPVAAYKTLEPLTPTEYSGLPETSTHASFRPNNTPPAIDELQRATRLLELESAANVHSDSPADILRRAQVRCDIENLPPSVIYHAAGRMCEQAPPERITAVMAAAQRLVAMQDQPGVTRPEEPSLPSELSQSGPRPNAPRAQDAGRVDGQDVLPPLYNPEWRRA